MARSSLVDLEAKGAHLEAGELLAHVALVGPERVVPWFPICAAIVLSVRRSNSCRAE